MCVHVYILSGSVNFKKKDKWLYKLIFKMMQPDVKIFIVSPRSATKQRTQKNIVKKVIKEIKNISLQNIH